MLFVADLKLGKRQVSLPEPIRWVAPCHYRVRSLCWFPDFVRSMNPMVCHGYMGNVRCGPCRHMTRHAFRLACRMSGPGKRGMARRTDFANLLVSVCNLAMWVVATSAPQLAAACSCAAARRKLFNLSHRGSFISALPV